jgi:thioredoxin-related protein
MMKKLILLFLFAPVLMTAQEKVNEINWISWDEAETKMAEAPRKVMVDVYTKWCGPCKIMNRTTFQDEEVIDYVNENYYAIKFDAESPDPITFKGETYTNDNYDPNKTRGRNSTHDLTKAIAPVKGRIAYPTIVYLDEDFKILAPVQGLQRPRQIKPVMSFFAENAYEDQTWEEYSKAQ